MKHIIKAFVLAGMAGISAWHDHRTGKGIDEEASRNGQHPQRRQRWSDLPRMETCWHPSPSAPLY